ncbi:hypothetical protein BACCIP111895_02552 [Neobacillus rhizosphaerae]|uniref:Uncharacterized protein n=1 Tax=Neobacillus rhizosphaerae TaxID=2880965 RepID=A0ABM9ET59_9BACI|nr:hypothetical protein [Neobacillus rhizosphaerae]CAH2715368.1 hypothetical protein BACCIP111895_02552 [Neobacillus rhizosphaerae]
MWRTVTGTVRHDLIIKKVSIPIPLTDMDGTLKIKNCQLQKQDYAPAISTEFLPGTPTAIN